MNEQETLFHAELLQGKREKYELELMSDFGGMVRITHRGEDGAVSQQLVHVSNTRYCQPASNGQTPTTPTATGANPPKTGK